MLAADVLRPAGVLLLLAGCAATPHATQTPPRAPACERQEPFRTSQLEVVYNVSFSFPQRNELEVRRLVADTVNARLNADGQKDEVSFHIADGATPNLYFNISIANDGKDHYRGYVNVTGMAKPYPLFNENSGEAPLADPPSVLNILADRIYVWIHNGWCAK